MPLIELKDATSRLYDYVIAGGGTAGLVLAARLSEDPGTSVLVLEAGELKENDSLILYINQFGQMFGRNDYDWCSMTTPQKYANSNVFPWPRGRVVGGSSAINFTGYNKPSREDIDAWEKLGNEGWNWDRFNKYMERAVTYTPPNFSDAEHARRGTPDSVRELWKNSIGNGPVQASHPHFRADLDIKIQSTFQNLGFTMATAPLKGDPNGLVMGAMTVDPKTGFRSFSGNAYWEPNSARSNFDLLTGAFVHRLVTTEDEGELVVAGVEFSHKSNGEIYTVKVSKEVILSAGTLLTPKILELSGIGRPDVLHKAGIPVKLALNGVGEDIQEHIYASVTFELPDNIPDETMDALYNPEIAKKHKELLIKGQGLYTMGIYTFLFAPFSTISEKANEIASKTRKRIGVEIAAGKYSLKTAEQLKIQLDHLEENVPSCEIISFPCFLGGAHPPSPGKRYWSFLAAINGTFSRGTIHVTSSNPQEQPAFDPHYFEQGIDLEMLREAVNFSRRILKGQPVKDYFKGEMPVELNPGAEQTTDEDIEEYLKKYTGTVFHTIGSAAMLPREKDGVVDTRLKVYGTKNLRIADLSIIPLQVGSHTQSIAYGVGEIAADIIKGLT